MKRQPHKRKARGSKINSSLFSRFQGMWLFAMFDLPVKSKIKRREYSKFRTCLLEEGFSMLQYSVYAKYCNSRENSVVYQNRLKGILPSSGQVRLLCVTEKQFGDMLIYYGKSKKKPEKIPAQILLL